MRSKAAQFRTWLVVLIGIVLSCLIWLWSVTPAIAQDLPLDSNIPTTLIEADGQYAPVPDWSQITFGTLPAILTDGEFVAPDDVNQLLGYDLSRSWQAGDVAASYLKLGDFQTSLYPQIFNLYTIAQTTNLDPSQVALSGLEMASWQTIDDLVTAIPGLGNYSVSEVAPIADLLKDKLSSVPQMWDEDAIGIQSTIGEVLNANPDLGKLSLGELENLSGYSLTDIPDLINAPLQNFNDWGNSLIGGVPGLADVPLSQMPNPVSVFGFLATVDVVYGTAESDRRNTISGSTQEGFSVPCQTNCAHVEFAGNSTVYGKQWISGKYQEAKGGFGVLGVVNGGKEPTGRHPFGDVFKVAVWDVEESTGTVTTGLFFRVCYRGIPDLGCTPYFIGPVPFLSFRETEPMLVGLLDAFGGASEPSEIPAGVMEKAQDWGVPLSSLGSANLGSGKLCGEGLGGIDFATLADAFSGIEGNYDSPGTYTCDGDSNCGRGLGRYQYMSYRSDVRETISRQDGGTAFLAKVDSGATVSSAELTRFFPASDQDALFKGDQTRNIQQAMSEGFSGGRLVERVGQIHYGGAGAPIDGGASDVHGRLTLKTYGEELRSNYESASQNKGSQPCANDTGGKSSGTLSSPVTNAPVTSEFGHRDSPCSGCSSFHKGIDFGVPIGTPVQAADGGTVAYAGWLSGYGNTMIVDHGNGTMTLYAHLDSMDVKSGTAVAKGQAIARSGDTGVGTGAHLHFEVIEGATPGDWRSGQSVDPRNYVSF
jgi:murein DD-endopeptidase MepM/ murein hydrolase activator NlpD